MRAATAAAGRFAILVRVIFLLELVCLGREQYIQEAVDDVEQSSTALARLDKRTASGEELERLE